LEEYQRDNIEDDSATEASLPLDDENITSRSIPDVDVTFEDVAPTPRTLKENGTTPKRRPTTTGVLEKTTPKLKQIQSNFEPIHRGAKENSNHIHIYLY
jgi:hypothetical protein